MNRYHTMYLDFLNNFISVDCFADHYDITWNKAYKIIMLGRACHESQFGPIV